MAADFLRQINSKRDDAQLIAADGQSDNLSESTRALEELAEVFLQQRSLGSDSRLDSVEHETRKPEVPLLSMEAKYRALVEQIPAVVFMAYLDKGIGEAYVSPQIEGALGFSQSEWLEDPVRWYQQIHPDDKMRWSVEAAEMFLSGKTLKVCVPSHCARWKSALVSVRGEDDSPGGRAAVVHPRTGEGMTEYLEFLERRRVRTRAEFSKTASN
jgi:PAS domain-containing protein